VKTDQTYPFSVFVVFHEYTACVAVAIVVIPERGREGKEPRRAGWR
jgi:hypothetical protein